MEIIDFLWLTSNLFLFIDRSSPSDCYLCLIKSFQENSFEIIRKYSIGNEGKKKKISVNSISTIHQIILNKRISFNEIILRVLALKTNGDIYLFDFNEKKLNQLIDLRKKFVFFFLLKTIRFLFLFFFK